MMPSLHENKLGGRVLTKKLALGLAAPLWLAVPAFAQDQDFSAVQIETQQLGDGLFMLIGSLPPV